MQYCLNFCNIDDLKNLINIIEETLLFLLKVQNQLMLQLIRKVTSYVERSICMFFNDTVIM